MDTTDIFTTPPAHVNFRAKKLFGSVGEIKDGAVAYLAPGGGGPVEPHTHPHNHLFIVVKGEAKVVFPDREVIIEENCSFLVDGTVPHSVWNNSGETAIIVGISVL